MSSGATNQIARSVRDTITALENTADVYSAAEKGGDLPDAFHEVAKALPPAQAALKAIKTYISTKKPEQTTNVDKVAAQKEKEAADMIPAKAARLYDIYDKVVPPGDGPRPARYRASAGRGERVEVLMKQILEGILVLAKKPAVSEAQIATLQSTLQEVAKIPPSLEEETVHSFHNYGSGPQSIHLGHGHQNMNTGSGLQFIGTFGGPFNLGGAAPAENP